MSRENNYVLNKLGKNPEVSEDANCRRKTEYHKPDLGRAVYP